MRTTLYTAFIAAGLALAAAACESKDRSKNVPIAKDSLEAADQASVRIREAEVPAAAERALDEVGEAADEIGSARATLAEETDEAGTEMGTAFGELRDRLRAMMTDATTFIANRDKVASEVRTDLDRLGQRIDRLGARSGELVGGVRETAGALVTETRGLMAEARSRIDALASADASTWEKRRDEALDALERLHDGVAKASATILTR